MNKNFIKYLTLFVLLFTFAFFASGCSGGGGSLFNNGGSQTGSGGGQGGAVSFKFNPSGGKYIPSDTYSLYISITGEGLSSATTKTVPYSSAAVTFENLPLGNKTAEITALDAFGIYLTKGRVSFLIEGGKTTSASVVLGIVFDDSSFSPSSMTIPANTTLFFYNAGNNSHILTGSSVFNGSSIAPGGSTSVLFSSAGTYVCYLDNASSGISCTITVGTPQITNINPSSGASVVDTVTITGSGFGSSQGLSTVTFNGTSAVSITSWSNTQIVCRIPAGASTGNVVVTVGSTSSNGVSFTVYYLAYVINNASNSISVIRSSDNTVVSTITGVGLNGPINLAITPDGNYIYVTNSLTGVSVIRRSDNVLVNTIPIDGQDGITITPNGNYVYTTNVALNTVSVIRTSDNAVIKTIAVGTRPYGPSCTPNGSFVYVPNWTDGTTSVIETTGNTVVLPAVTVQQSPRNSAASPNGNYVYVANSGGVAPAPCVSVINTSTPGVTNILFDPGSIVFNLAVTPNGNYLYVIKNGTNAVAVIQTSDNSILTSIGVGTFPYGIAVTPDGSYVYVTNVGSNYVSVIRTSDNMVVAMPVVGNSSNGVAVAK